MPVQSSVGPRRAYASKQTLGTILNRGSNLLRSSRIIYVKEQDLSKKNVVWRRLDGQTTMVWVTHPRLPLSKHAGVLWQAIGNESGSLALPMLVGGGMAFCQGPSPAHTSQLRSFRHLESSSAVRTAIREIGLRKPRGGRIQHNPISINQKEYHC